MIRSSFVAAIGTSSSGEDAAKTDEENAQSRISPTSVVDFRPSFMTSTSTSTKSSSSSKESGNQIIIQQLKRRMTYLEHEKANMEKDLMNQINTVVFDKDTIVGSLKDKITQYEQRYKEERQAHADTKNTLRHQRFADADETKMEVFRLQDRVQEIADEKSALQSQVEQMKSEKARNFQSIQRLHERIREITDAKKSLQYELDKLCTENEESSQSFLSQLTCMEETHQAQLDALKKDYEKRISEIKQSQVAALADLEHDLFQRHQAKIKEVSQAHKAEIAAKDAEMAKLQRKSVNKNAQSCPPQNTQPDDEALSLQNEIMSLVNKLSRAEADNMNLRDSFEKEKNKSRSLSTSLEDTQQKMSDYVTIFEEERATQKEKVESLSLQLEEERTTNTALQKSLNELQASYDELLKAKQNDRDEGKQLLQKQMDELRQQIDEREAANNKLHNSIRELEANNKELQASLQEAQEQSEDLASLRTEKESLKKEVEDLTEQVEESNEAIEMLKDSLTDMENDNAKLSSSLDDKDSMISHLENEKASLLSSQSEEQETLQEQLDGLETHLKETRANNENLQASIHELESSNSNLRSAQESKDTTIARLEEEKEKSFARNKDLLELIDLARHRESALNTSVKEHQETISELKLTIESRNEKIKALEEQLKELQDQLVQEQTTVASLMDSLGNETNEKSMLYESQMDLDDKIKRLENEKSSLIDEIDNLKEEMRHEKGINESLKASIRSEETENADLLATKSKLRTDIAELNDQLEQKSEELQYLKTHLEAEKIAKNDLLSMNESLEDEKAKLEEEINSLSQRIDSANEQFQKERELTQSSMASLEEKEREIEELSTAKEEKIWAWQKQCVIFHLQATVLKDLVDQAESTQWDLRALTERQKALIKEYQKGKEDSIAGFQRDRLSLLDRIGDLKGSLEEKQRANASLQSSLEEYKEAYTDMNYYSQKQQSQIVILKASLKGAHRQLQCLQTDKTELLDRANTLQQEIDSVREEKASLGEQILSLSSQLDEHKAELVTLKRYTENADESTIADEGVDESFSSIDGKPASTSSPEKGEEDRVKILESSVQKLKAENEELRNSLEEHGDIQESINVLMSKKKELLSDIDELYSQLRQKQSDQPDPTVSLEEEQMYSIVKATLDDQKTKDDTIMELQEEMEGLRQQITESKAASESELEALRSKLEALQSARQELESDNEAKDAKIKELESEISDAEDTKAWLEKSLDEVEQLREKMSKTSEALEQVEQKIEVYTDKVEELETELFEAKKSAEIAEEEIERLQDLLSQTELEHANATNTAGSCEDAEAAEKLKAEIERLKTVVEQSEARRMDRESKLKVAYKREVGQYRERIEAFEKQLLEEKEALQMELEELKKGRSSQTDEMVRLRSELSATKQALDGLEQEKTTLKNRLEDFEAARMEKLLLEIKEQKQTEALEVDLSKTKKNLKDSKEEILKLRAQIETMEGNLKSSLARAHAFEASTACKNETSKQEAMEMESFYMERLRELEAKQTSLQAELDEKKKEVDGFSNYFRDDDSRGKSREELEAELKALHEKTIVQARMIHSLQKKIEVLEQGKEKLYEAKRKEIMRDRSEISSLRKDNTRLREKVNAVTRERRSLQEQLESFANSIGSSVGRFTSPSSGSKKADK